MNYLKKHAPKMARNEKTHKSVCDTNKERQQRATDQQTTKTEEKKFSEKC